ncbi:TetR/AcrR family transcriptional regulator [Spirillospora sp. CA-255316]
MTTSGTRHPAFVPPAPPRTPKSAGTRRLLLDTAAGLFVERGYSAVSMNEIASGANLTKGALYGHFRSKGQLLVEVIRWKLADRDHGVAFTQAITGPEPAVGLFFDAEGRDVRLLEVDAAAAARHDPDVAAGLADLYRERLGRIQNAMEATRDPETAAWLIAALAGGIGMKEASRLPLPDADRLSAVILGVLQRLD